MSDKQVANLIGGVEFKVDLTQLERLFAELQKTERKLRAFGKFAEKPLKIAVQLDTKAFDKQMRELEAKVRKQMGIVAPEVRAKTSHRHDMQTQRLERASQQARQATFAAELQQQKLAFAGRRDEVMLTTAGLKAQQESAVLAAKQAAAQAAANKERITAVALEERIAQAKAKQLRADALLAAARDRAAVSQQRYLQSLTQTQRQQLALDQTRERGDRQRQQAMERRQLQLSRESRAQDGAEQRRGRYRMAEEKHAVWKQRQQERDARKARGSYEPDVFDLTAGGFGARAGAAGLAVYGIASALTGINDKLNQTVANIAAFDRTKIVAGNAVEGSETRQENYRKWLADTANELGANLESTIEPASSLVRVQRENGMGTRQALDNTRSIMEVQSIFHSTTEQARNISTQLSQVWGKGRLQGDDLDALVEGGGISSLRAYLQKAWAASTNYKGDNVGEAYAAAQKAGQIKPEMVMSAFRLIVAQNQQALKAYQDSPMAADNRYQNAKYVQQMEVNTDPELLKATKDLRDAQTELYRSMLPVQRAFASFNAGAISGLAHWINALTGNGKPEDAGKTSVTGSGAIGSGTAPTADDYVKLVSGDPEKFKQPGQGVGLLTKFKDWMSSLNSGTMLDDNTAVKQTDSSLVNTTLMPSLQIDRAQLMKFKEGVLRNNQVNQQAGQQVQNVVTNNTNTGNTTNVANTSNNTFNITSNDTEGVRREITQALDQRDRDMMTRATSGDVPK
ncbi:tape measure protein [Pseudomonas sp. Snoq117.2]|uniref:tape measure protein n=1 Tax=Pseudomonas sp. Snoq117.2 TaxID=1500302 RepID=UPI0008C3BD67|nr:tape measure protein [Pseudomonas sp. Snoq117.2]SEP41579.1 hypothetical protein SAMN02787149_1118 [Pseudomonas sp. Snoq117.2]